MSYTSLDITTNNQSLETNLINATTNVNPIELDLIAANNTTELNTIPADVIQKGEWGNISGDINEQPDLAGYINKVVDEKMNGIKILTVS